MAVFFRKIIKTQGFVLALGRSFFELYFLLVREGICENKR